ncbi:MAG TPA: class F sortase [Thermomicrobiales bacterium]|nr:class F sortase [Thermomicrobiales bacterium]
MTQQNDAKQPAHIDRRSLLLAFAGAAGAVVAPRLVAAQTDPSTSGGGTGIETGDGGAQAGNGVTIAEMPSSGGARPGPILTFSSTPEPKKPKGLTPTEIQIDKAGVDAPVEEGTISPDGVMVDPSGPWVVTWYKALSMLGTKSNVVMAGHIDYWGVGPSVFQALPNMAAGDTIRVIADDGEVFEYETEWSRLFNVATELTPEVIQKDVVGPTGKESLTLITCGGDFDQARGEYVSRQVLRANMTNRTDANGNPVRA